jgi:hypothetical protein
MQKEAGASCSARELNPCFSSDRTATCLEGLANPTPIASGHRGAVRENREPYQCARHICRDCSALWRPHFADHHMTSFGPLVQIFCNNARNEAAASIVRQTRLARKHSSKPRGSYRGDLRDISSLIVPSRYISPVSAAAKSNNHPRCKKPLSHLLLRMASRIIVPCVNIACMY